MKYLINLRRYEDIAVIKNTAISEVLLQTGSFCRFGGIVDNDILRTVEILKESEKQVILAWDFLAKDEEIEESFDRYHNLGLNSQNIDAIRFLDPGMGKYLQKSLPKVPLHLSLEHGSLNKSAIKGWMEQFEGSLKRWVISTQYPIYELADAVKASTVPCEVYGFGPIEMMYTRRKLLNSLDDSKNSGAGIHIASNDRPEQLNRVLNTSKATLVFYDKTLNRISKIPDLKEFGIQYFRMEYYDEEGLNNCLKILNEVGQGTNTISQDLNEFVGFEHSNETDKLFEHLSNPTIKSELDNKIGVVLESVKNSHCVIELLTTIQLPLQLEIVSPENKRIEVSFKEMLHLNGAKVQRELIEPGIYRSNWFKFAVSGSVLTLVKG